MGFDVAPIQPALESLSLPPDVQARIRWINGNLYVARDTRITYEHPISLQELPFDDESFDFVRCDNVAQAIPENKVGSVDWGGVMI